MELTLELITDIGLSLRTAHRQTFDNVSLNEHEEDD